MKTVANMGEGMRIGALARAAGLSVEAVRYYEARGLLPKPRRSAAGYRLYGPEAARRLRFVRRAQALGFSLAEIGELLALRVKPDADCAQMQTRAGEKLALITARIEELQRLRRALARLAETCDGQSGLEQCPILRMLEEETHEQD